MAGFGLDKKKSWKTKRPILTMDIMVDYFRTILKGKQFYYVKRLNLQVFQFSMRALIDKLFFVFVFVLIVSLPPWLRSLKHQKMLKWMNYINFTMN